MALLWCCRTDSWRPVGLTRRTGLADAIAGGGAERPAAAESSGASGALVTPVAGAGSDRWALLAGGATDTDTIRVNGEPLRLGLRILHDRDAIRVPGEPPVFYSAERLAELEALPDALTEAFCPRCKRLIAPGSPGVLCPRCSTWHHQTEERPCWTYAATCAVCDQPTAEDAGYSWTPEEL